MMFIDALLMLSAHVQPTDVTVPAISQVESVPREPSPFDFVRGVRDHYRTSMVHDRCEFVVAEDGGDRIRTEITLRSVPNTEGPRLMLEFGPFTMLAEANRFSMVHRHNRKSVLLTEGSPVLKLIRDVMPPLPIPQIPLVVQGVREDSSVLDELESLGAWFQSLQISSVRRHDQGFIAEGETLFGNRALIRTDISFRILHIRSEIKNGPVRGVLEMNAFELPPCELESWDHFVGDRELVGQLTSLISLPSAVQVGDPLPELGLVDDALQPWSFDAAIERGVAAAPASRQFIALVFYDTSSDAARRDASIALDALRDVSRQLRRAAALGTGPMIRLSPITVGAIQWQSLSTDVIRFEQERLSEPLETELLEVEDSFAWAPPFADPIQRFHPDDRCVVAIVDSHKRVVSILSILDDREALIHELKEVVR